MIPLKLNLNNFICYRENVPTLDFAGIHVACLCGANGNGKSALLDGITWALWGKARGKTHDDLISYGADECRVELDFSSRNQDYRVIRSHARAGKRRRGPSDMQLMLLNGSDSVPLTGNMMRETQAQIEKTVGMDYETFVNSAFLVQGRADEFTNRTPAERKAVLSKILGLETYDRLQARAKERGDQTKSSSVAIQSNIDHMRFELDQLGTPAVELTTVEQELEYLGFELAGHKFKTTELRDQIAELRRHQAQQKASRDRLETLSQELAGLESAEKAAKTKIAEFEALQAQAENIRQGAAKLASARLSYDGLEQKRAEYEGLERERTTLRGTIEVRRTRLESELEELRKNIDVRLAPKVLDLGKWEAELLSVQAGEASLDVQEREIVESRERMTTLSNQMGQLESSIERFTNEGKELATKLEMLGNATDIDAVCPLCQTPLSEDGCGRLGESYRNEIGAKRQDYREASAQLSQLQVQGTELETQLPKREQELAGAQTRRRVRLNELEVLIGESRLASEEMQKSLARLEGLKQSIFDGGFAADETAQLRNLEARILELGYDDQVRQRSYQEAQELEGFARQELLLDQAETGLPGAREALAQNAEMVRRRVEETGQLRRSLADGEAAVTRLPELEAGLLVQEEKEAVVAAQVQGARARQGYIQGQVERKETLTRDLETELRRLAKLLDEQSVYQELATAFGRQGVQAMLIETVVPRLEEEANALLGRMTDNRMNVKLETLRERASGQGEPKETLEIQVSDELGPRSYEMYSGGEAFRVNLALRIALSRVLAQRMGAPLPTLFIDEGFGTQDAIGRERILDVISVIGTQFEKVIVITHLDDLKEAFPVRIEVQKDSNGSTFWLN